MIQLIISPCPFCLSISSLSSCSRAFNLSAAIDELLRSSGGVVRPLELEVVGCDVGVIICCEDDDGGADTISGDTGGEDETCVKNSVFPCLIGGRQPGRCAADIFARND